LKRYFKIIAFILFFFATNVIYAQISFLPIRQVGLIPCGIGMTVSDDNVPSFDFDISLLYLSGEFWPIGIGITWIPVNYKYIQNNHYFNVFNFQVYWNIFEILLFNHKKINNNIFIAGAIFGPFASISCALNLNTPRVPFFSDYIFSTGLRYNFTDRSMEGILRAYYFNLECGYRNINGQDSFYMSMNIDIYFVMSRLIASILY